ncbi:uncharacterized protein N7479_008267 [Penicillium vulpinum]|uniref:Uncharacterized protein n=1 Tax=Penicillium vulpinum TaxID=29845 RepID=A0A1V6RJJ3_9EURO|nr:uncharacterized protein N7479_008267 [Penicillium vulpinum]KAJ5961117.1 hypothetical protein N7479_008267 [Penicillium vulpinum]OQE01599.1 hypothetical protein PENVUL_c042G04212 [Penicillium vulpinum]
MAPSQSFILFLSFVLSPFVQAAPWLVTDVYEQVITTDYYSELTTIVQRITPTAALPDEALSTLTTTNTVYDYTIIQKLYPAGYGEKKGYYGGYGESLGSDGNYHSTIYKVNLTYSAPTACSTQWTTTTAASFSPPYEIASLLPTDNVEASTSVDNSQPFQPTTYIYKVIFVDPTQIPTITMNSLSLYNAPTSRYSGSGCEYTTRASHYGYSDDYNTGETASGVGSSSSTDNNDSESGYYDDYWDGDNWFTSKRWTGIGISYLAVTLICLLGWIGLVFILGMIEAWIRFRRLMTGWQTRRGLPLFWAFILLPLSLFFLCCFRKGYRARSKEDAEILQRRWKNTGFWAKIRLFFIWGFRFEYPDVLGPAPALVRASKRPTESGPRLLDATPPGTHAPSLDGSAGTAPPAGPEMAQAQAPGHQAYPYDVSQPSSTPPAGRGE